MHATQRSSSPRRGSVSVLAAVLLLVVMAIIAFAVDIGYLMLARSDLQRAADAAAHAAVLEYHSEAGAYAVLPNVRSRAQTFVSENPVLNAAVSVDANTNNADLNGDLVLGRIDFDNPRSGMSYSDYGSYNAIKVRISRTSTKNGQVPLFFARVLGYESLGLVAESTAAIIHNVSGFKIPGSGENVPFLPITIHEDYWESEVVNGNDNWSWDESSKSVSSNSDGLHELVLFPTSPDSSGNFGTVNVGTSANSASNLGRQIRDGLSQSDLDFHGGTLELDDYGKLMLTGDPGLSASIKDDIASITGKPAVIPIYRTVENNGNNANYTIVKFVGVRVMASRLTGNNKHVTIQPSNVTFRGTIQAKEGWSETSDSIFSVPIIVQ